MFLGLLTDIIDYQNDLFRNIRSPQNTIDCFDDLGDGGLDTEVAVAAEMLGHEPSHAPVITRSFDYGVITYPFMHEPWLASRFSSGQHYGVFYGSEELETTVLETVHHWRQFILATYPDQDEDIFSERRVVLVLCRGLLVDLRGKEEDYPTLLDQTDYTFTNQIGQYLHDQNQNGLLVRSARCGGTNAAIFTEKVLSNPRDHCYLTYRWNPARDLYVRVERGLGEDWMQV